MKRYKVRQRIEVNRVRNKPWTRRQTRKRERKSMSPSASVKATE